jgi:3-hydroxyisobutyrate dehydrogenase-like beta-hydroxyacid dehydrogenase
MQLGYIGTGTMGNPMAKALIEAGHSVTVFDVRRESATNLCEMGANWAESPQKLAEVSEVVFTSLPGPVETENVLTAPDTGILAGLRTGCTWIDTTTNSPTVIHHLADVCTKMGIKMLDCPVSGRIPNMTMMVGGDPEVFEQHRSVLETMGKDVIYVDMDILAKLIPISASASGVMARSLDVVLDGTFASNGTLDIVAKDLHLACQLARDVQAPSRMGDIVDDVLQRAQAQGLGTEGYPVVARILEQMAGAEVRSKPKQ